jgi:plasmid stability protein
MEKYARLTLDLPSELHQAIKIRAARRRESMSAWLRQVIEQALRSSDAEPTAPDPLSTFVGRYRAEEIGAPPDLVRRAEDYVREGTT